ncbi:NAD(P)/FAD-dependent oxidoreductase [Candidatus Formimonas warabiya]|uniref:NAD(P)/FAD-dependent oxidoreductase n=1 Tax=Formimonas warabiya TaxID=1761012 RepID=UPI0011D064B2|nr:NAD(P)/FAD-dependent oxidoreductase [Candidatus Formimonas warabiya]
MKNVIVVGGGASGIFAAVKAREMGARVTLMEKNNRLGKKMLITGKGRCNITNAGTLDDFIANIPGNGPFLYSAFSLLSNQDTMDFFHRLGVPTKVERGDRVFPVSDRSADVVEALKTYLQKIGVSCKYHLTVESLAISQGVMKGVDTAHGFFSADAVIVATGGASYPGTGSTGDGYQMARQAGHTIVPLKPSLVPLETVEPWVKELQGLTLKNVKVTAWADGKILSSEFGEMLFTHFGVSGPVILSLSKVITASLDQHPRSPVQVIIDLKPALSFEQLDQRLQRDFQKYSRKYLANSFTDLLPKSLIPVFVQLLPISGDKFVHQITKEERGQIIKGLKEFTVTIKKPRPLAEAIVTSGGVSVKEINPKTMESKRVKGLFFAGEVLDIDGFTGGYNLQAAFSTGFAAGKAAAE